MTANPTDDHYILVGDIGGTNSRLELYKVAAEAIGATVPHGENAPGTLIYQAKYPNENYDSFVEVVVSFLTQATAAAAAAATAATAEAKKETQGQGLHITVAAFAVAGPVDDGAASLSNRGSWTFCETGLARDLGVDRVVLANDFEAVGYGVLTLGDSDLVTLQGAPARLDAPIACVGAGTGLGECFAVNMGSGSDSTGYKVFPSEGGHAEFAPRNPLEVEMLSFLKEKFKEKHRISVERVVSGRGLVNVYEFLVSKYPNAESDTVAAAMLCADDQKGAVVARFADDGDELCSKAMNIMLAAYGSEVGVAGLKWLPFGGLYIAGGLAPKNIARIVGDGSQDSLFMAAFHDKGRLSPMLRKIPVHVVMNEDVGLRGAHLVAYRGLCRHLQ